MTEGKSNKAKPRRGQQKAKAAATAPPEERVTAPKAKALRQKAVAALGPPEKLLGLELARLRERRKLTIAEAARRLKLGNKSTLHNMEKGQYSPRPEVVLAIADFYHVSGVRLLALLRRGLAARVEQEHREAVQEWKNRQRNFSFSEPEIRR